MMKKIGLAVMVLATGYYVAGESALIAAALLGIACAWAWVKSMPLNVATQEEHD